MWPRKWAVRKQKKFHLRSVFTPSYTSNSLSLMVWWQNVVLYAPTELNSSIPTEGTDVPEELTKTVTDKWVIQGSSCWTVLNISVSYLQRLGWYFSFRQEKERMFFYFQVFFYFVHLLFPSVMKAIWINYFIWQLKIHWTGNFLVIWTRSELGV